MICGASARLCQSDNCADARESVVLARQGIAKWADVSSTGESRYRATSLLERFNREIRVRERMGTVWTVHNLLVLLLLRGVLA